MKITKLGHCCLLIEDGGKRILTDPGDWNELPENLDAIDLLIITHEHGDHYHVPSVKKIIAASPALTIVTNNSVAKLLKEEGIEATILTDGQEADIKGVNLCAYGKQHKLVYEGINQPENTGYFINNKLFYPGDAFTNPQRPVPVLALPVAGLWLSMKEVIDYAREINPEESFPVHDGVKYIEPYHYLPSRLLSEFGIKFTPLKDGEILSV